MQWDKPSHWEQVGPLLERVLDGMGLGGQMRQHRAAARFEEAAGKKIASRAKVARVQQGVLWLQVSGPQWAAEISLRKKEILDKLNELAGDKVLTDIRFVGAWEGRKR